MDFVAKTKRENQVWSKLPLKFPREGPYWTHSILPVKSVVVSVSCSSGENLFFLMFFSVRQQVKQLVCISGLCPMEESVRQEVRGLPDPVEDKSSFIFPESDALEEIVGQVVCTI